MHFVSVLLPEAVGLKSWKTALKKLDNIVFFSRNSVPVIQDSPQASLAAIFGGNISRIKSSSSENKCL